MLCTAKKAEKPKNQRRNKCRRRHKSLYSAHSKLDFFPKNSFIPDHFSSLRTALFLIPFLFPDILDVAPVLLSDKHDTDDCADDCCGNGYPVAQAKGTHKASC